MGPQRSGACRRNGGADIGVVLALRYLTLAGAPLHHPAALLRATNPSAR
jgi:hypothetical protein